jgi:hypothetical protein
MDMTEEKELSLRDAFVEIAFLVIEINQQYMQIKLNKVSKDAMDAFQEEIDHKLKAIETQIGLIKKAREFIQYIK